MKYFNKLLKDTSGFSIVELGIVIVIGALMTIPIYTLLFYVTDLKPTDERVEIIQEALAEHLRVTGTLPCPADPALDIDSNANAYTGFKDGNDQCTSATLSGGVYIGAVPIQNLKVAVACAPNNGEISADFTDALRNGIFNITDVLTGRKGGTDVTGALQSNRADGIRCLQNEYILNAEGQKFVYAVSANAVVEGSDIFAPGFGNIIIQNAAGNIIDSNRIYTLVSLGEDGKGGFDRSGQAVNGACGTSDADFENCDNDNVFVAAPPSISNDSYYDDTIEYGIARFMQEDSFFKWGTNTAGQRHMNLNQNAALIIDPLDANTESEFTNNADHKIAADDSLVVNRGGIFVEGDLTIHAQSFADTDGSAEVGGGELKANDLLEVADKTNIRDIAVAPKYCYEDSISEACKEGEDDGNTGGTCKYGYQSNGNCCGANDTQCCPAMTYKRPGHSGCQAFWD